MAVFIAYSQQGMSLTKKTSCKLCVALEQLPCGLYYCKLGKQIDNETAVPKEKCFKPKSAGALCKVQSYEEIEAVAKAKESFAR